VGPLLFYFSGAKEEIRLAIEKVLEIREVEAEAQKIRANATEEAKKLMEDARQDVIDVAARAEDQVSDIFRDKLAKAESEAKIIYNSILLNAEKDCELLQARAEKKKAKAVAVIMERIVK
jgi:vacuolar-type H+-ATPase subunit H